MTVAQVIESDDRRLLAEVSKWAHANGWTDGGWRGYMNARYELDATVIVRPHEAGFDVWRKEACQHLAGRPAEYSAVSVREAIDLLCALRVLPDRFSSAFYAGVDACQPTMRRLVDGLVFGSARDYVRLREQVGNPAVSIRSGDVRPEDEGPAERCPATGEELGNIATIDGRWVCCGSLYPDHAAQVGE